MLYGGHVKTLEDIQWLKSHHLDFGEVVLKNAESLEFWKSHETGCRGENGFFLVAHGPHEGDPNSYDNLQNNYMPILKETVRTASQMGINFLTTHLWMDSRYVKPEMIESKIEALMILWEFGRNEGVAISLENLSESTTDLERAISAIPGLNLTLDVGHGQLLTETNRSFEIIRDHASHVKHVHMHDNMGGIGVKDDLHLPLGNGIVDFEGIFTALIRSGYSGTITLELKPEELEVSLPVAKSMAGRISKELGLGKS